MAKLAAERPDRTGARPIPALRTWSWTRMSTPSTFRCCGRKRGNPAYAQALADLGVGQPGGPILVRKIIDRRAGSIGAQVKSCSF